MIGTTSTVVPRMRDGLTAPYAVPKLWPGCTMVCLGDGPSLTVEDVEFVRGKARILAMNYSFRLAPWADVLWSYHSKGLETWSGLDLATFKGRVFTAETMTPPPPWPVLRLTGHDGLDLDPHGIRHGNNSGYSAINLAIHLGAVRIILLGYDCGEDPKTGRFHWTKPQDDPTRGCYSYDLWRQRFATLPGPLKEAGIEVLNASRYTTLEFPCVDLGSALQSARL